MKMNSISLISLARRGSYFGSRKSACENKSVTRHSNKKLSSIREPWSALVQAREISVAARLSPFVYEECTCSCLCNQYSLRKKSISEKRRNLSIGVAARIIPVLLNINTPSYAPQRLKVSFARIGCFRKEPNNSSFFQKARLEFAACLKKESI